jgi:hypothetical protein
VLLSELESVYVGNELRYVSMPRVPTVSIPRVSTVSIPRVPTVSIDVPVVLLVRLAVFERFVCRAV